MHTEEFHVDDSVYAVPLGDPGLDAAAQAVSPPWLIQNFALAYMPFVQHRTYRSGRGIAGARTPTLTQGCTPVATGIRRCPARLLGKPTHHAAPDLTRAFLRKLAASCLARNQPIAQRKQARCKRRLALARSPLQATSSA
ncbi:hypothetical protein ON010_g8156 [Phytophthora cinnamomi]|nr:hypothetical protein ON010_g8156 [Phytophthora cinnamomi]